MNTQSPVADHSRQSSTQTALRPVQLLVGGYLALSLLTLAAIAVLRNNTAAVNSAVWTRGTIVAISAVLLFTFTTRAARGFRRPFLRLRIVSAIMVTAIVIIIALPGPFPVWMKIEQGICGLILLVVVVLVNRPRVRSLFASR